MGKSIKILTACFILLISGAVMAEDASLSYVMAVADFFNADYDQVNDVLNSYVKIEEVPVVYYVAQNGKADPIEVAKMRLDGNSWADICSSFNVSTDRFYVMTTRGSKSKAYNATFAKFKTTPTNNWDEIELTDEEYINLVNLRFIYKHHDYNPYAVMAMEDLGKDFVKINTQIRYLKDKMLEKQMAQAEK